MIEDINDFDIDVDQICSDLHLSKEVFLRILNTSFISCSTDIDDLQRAYENKNIGEIETISHRLKGVFANLRLKPLADLSTIINDEIKNDKDFDVMLDALNTMKAMFLNIKSKYYQG